MEAEVKTAIEEWRAIPSGPALYEASSAGAIRRRWKNHALKPSLTNSGYQTVVLYCGGRGTHRYVHQLVAEAFCDRSSARSEVNHKNGIKTDNRAENLEWCTRRENVDDAKRRGWSVAGEKNPKARITEAIAQRARRLRRYEGWSFRRIAVIVGATESIVSAIVNERTWKDSK